MPLTDTQIRKLKPSEKCTPNRPDKYSDGNGLQLWVRHTGNKVWISAYRYLDKQQSLTLGKYPALGLADARVKNAEIKNLLANGIDPKAEKQKQTAIKKGVNLFSTIAQQWHDDRQAHIKPSTYTRDHSQYIRDIKPYIGNMDIADITAPDILDIANRIEARGAGDMARRAIQQIGQIYSHAIRLGKIKHNPATGLTKVLKPRQQQHHARIKINELPTLLKDIDSDSGELLTKLGLYFLCYTFVRTNELRFMEWSEIDYQAQLWRIPAERMKMKRPHIVPLSRQALAILDQIKALNLSNKYVFFNISTKKPLSENAFLNALERMGYKGRMTGHGFRGLASTTLHERQYMHEAIELQLAHDKENKISKAYNGAEHLPYRIKMMNEWADFVDNLKAGKVDNIIYFTSHASNQKQAQP
ncbi:DUF4102 domain-containing protein [Leucothrix sargassi]|nr:DUF4102 domain-containing protein [Leucothrix sargassi]